MKIIFLVVALLALLSNFDRALAVDILTSAEHTFFSPDDKSRVGIEVEFSGISLDDATKSVIKSLGGTAKLKTVKVLTTAKTDSKGNLLLDSKGNPIYNEVTAQYNEIKNTKLGTILMKIESNQVNTTAMTSDPTQIIELVTEPISGLEKVETLQIAIDELKVSGAKGTSPKLAVSTQVNVEIKGGEKAEIKAADLVNLMRVYFKHWDQVHQRVKIPEVRKPYVQGYSDGFLKKLFDPDYRPSWEQLFNDYIYRQSLEVLGHKDAWTIPIATARSRLLAYKIPIVPRVIKQNALRITSLLAYMVPDDEMTKIITHPDTGWVKPYPIIEYREWNNTFDVVSPYKQSLGLVSSTQEYGFYDHDRLMSQLSGVDVDQIKQLRNRSLAAEKSGKPVTWRYFLADPNGDDLEDYIKHKAAMYQKDDLVGFLAPNYRGRRPLFVPGESVIMHRRPFHKYNILGKHNPGLVNDLVALALENKYVEARFLEEVYPGALPTTELLTDIIGSKSSLESITSALNDRFPKGWVIKGIWDLGTEGLLVSSKMDFNEEIEIYRNSNFDAVKAKIDADPVWRDVGIDWYYHELKKYKGYKGWKLSQLLKNRSQFLVQEMVTIKNEYRVEVFGGKVLGAGSTIDRWAYKTNYKKKPDPAAVKKVESYVASILKRIPAELRGMPFAFDIAETANGALRIIESNPGNNSSFLYEEDWKPSVKALTEFLETYPEEIHKGKLLLGLSPEEQIKWIKKKFSSWNIDVPKLYQGYAFTKNAIFDKEYPPLAEPDPKEFRVTPKECAAAFKALVK